MLDCSRNDRNGAKKKKEMEYSRNDRNGAKKNNNMEWCYHNNWPLKY